MNTIVLEKGDLRAEFAPEMGMNLLSYKKGAIEIIEQSTRNLFDERYAGLGALIGPHFYRRKTERLPKIKDESLFPHIARVKSHGPQDPFSHGIGRYAPWKTDFTKTKVNAILTGKDLWNGVPLAELEGQNFTMTLTAELTDHGLVLNLSVVSDTDSLVGIHYYYSLPEGNNQIISAVQDTYIKEGKKEPIPADWKFDAQQVLTLDLNQELDLTFHPFPKPLEGKILLKTAVYTLLTHYSCQCAENSWQLYHPIDSRFVCIEPISSQDPRHPNLSVSSLRIELEIQDPD